jgi:multiple sugar transport system permease protein
MAGGVDQQGPQTVGRAEQPISASGRGTTPIPVKSLAEIPVATRLAEAARRAPRSHRAAQLGRIAALCVAPAAVFLLVLIAYPLSRVIWSAFHYVNLTNPTVAGFAGLDNFSTVLEDEHFWPSLWHTCVWTVVSVVGEYVLGLASAVALAQPIRARSVFRGIIIIPWVIPIVVAGLNWTWMLTPDYGILNIWMVKLGLLSKPFYWLGNLDSALLTISFVNIWRSFPFYTISLLAALMAVPREVIESAAIDGARPLQRFIYITMPYLKTVSLTLIFIHVIWTAINFDFIWVMTQGGPYNASETLPIMIYRYALEDFDVGAASALAMMTMGFMLAAFFVYWYGAGRSEEARAW